MCVTNTFLNYIVKPLKCRGVSNFHVSIDIIIVINEYLIIQYQSITFLYRQLYSISISPSFLLVLDGVEHKLVVEEPDEVEGAEAGGRAQRQVPDYHRRVE